MNSSLNLSDSLRGYITASEEDCDNTLYFSVLNQDLTLEEIDVTPTNAKNIENNDPELVSIENNHPVIFNVDANNQICSVQMTEDEDGNLQKYQIQYSEDINGELAPMLETIQFLPLEYEEEVVTEGNSLTNDNFIMTKKQLSEETDNYNMENSLEEEHEWNISPVVCPTFKIPIKTETDQFFNQCLDCDTVEDQSTEEPDLVKMKSERFCENEDEAVRNLEIDQIDENRERLEEKLVSETDDVTSVKTEIYHHQNVNCILKESIDQPKTNVSKRRGQRSLLEDFVNSQQRIVYMRALPEKENMKAVDIESFIKPNSRSQLKCNQPVENKKTDDANDKNSSGSKEKLIEISDTDESDATEAGKKNRGRSVKRKDDLANSPAKVSRLDGEVTSTLKLIGMGNEKSAKEKVDTKSKVWKNGFECDKCRSKFINKFVLNRHQCVAKLGSNNLSCETCKLKFSNVSSLNLHKTSHNKETATSRIPKVKVNSEKEAATSKPQKTTKPSLSLKNAKLSILPTKNKPPPVNAKKTNSVYVKVKVPEEPIQSEETEKDTVSIKGLLEVTPEKSSKSNVFKCEIQCDKCSKQFENHATWFQHQVLNHGLKTPDTNIREKKQKKLAKDTITHNGIRATPTVAKSFLMLSNKVKHI